MQSAWEGDLAQQLAEGRGGPLGAWSASALFTVRAWEGGRWRHHGAASRTRLPPTPHQMFSSRVDLAPLQIHQKSWLQIPSPALRVAPRRS